MCPSQKVSVYLMFLSLRSKTSGSPIDFSDGSTSSQPREPIRANLTPKRCLCLLRPIRVQQVFCDGGALSLPHFDRFFYRSGFRSNTWQLAPLEWVADMVQVAPAASSNAMQQSLKEEASLSIHSKL